ncbi:MAG: hypothetical protein AAGK38_04775, partial [Pseudomonadota bacterium]
MTLSNRSTTGSTGVLQDQVRHYLDRARVSAQRGTLTGNTPVEPVVERLLRVMRKLNPAMKFSLE